MAGNSSDQINKIKQGDLNALETFLNQKLSVRDITAKVSVKNDCLIILFQSSQSLPKQYLVDSMQKLIAKVNHPPWNNVTIYGQIIGEDIPDWVEIIKGDSSNIATDERNKQLDRIAIALERIANSLENQTKTTSPEVTKNTETEETGSANEELPENREEHDSQNLEEDIIENFLTSRDIEIKTVPEEDDKDKVINSLAKFLGDHYSTLSELLSQIKSKMQKGEGFKLKIGDYTQQEISHICDFCTRLHSLALLEDYKYFNSPRFLVTARTTTLATAQNFFSGQWLERFVLQTVKESINILSNETGKDIDFAYLLNPQIILPNGNDFELDLIFHVNESIYWIEAKTGDYQSHIQKYSEMSKIFNLDYQHSIMVLPDIPADTSSDLTSLFSMTVYNLSQFQSGLLETMRNDLNAYET